MPKGKTNQPLIILIDNELINNDSIKKLQEEGHDLAPLAFSSTEYDLILSQKAWKWDEKYVGMAIKAARKLKRETKDDSSK